MAEPLFTDVFGAGATQDLTTLTILKADLPNLTAAADNRPEQLFSAVFLKAEATLTTTNQETNPEQNITIETPAFGAETLVDRNNQRYRQFTRTVNFQKLDTSTGIDPDDF